MTIDKVRIDFAFFFHFCLQWRIIGEDKNYFYFDFRHGICHGYFQQLIDSEKLWRISNQSIPLWTRTNETFHCVHNGSCDYRSVNENWHLDEISASKSFHSIQRPNVLANDHFSSILFSSFLLLARSFVTAEMSVK